MLWKGRHLKKCFNYKDLSAVSISTFLFIKKVSVANWHQCHVQFDTFSVVPSIIYNNLKVMLLHHLTDAHLKFEGSIYTVRFLKRSLQLRFQSALSLSRTLKWHLNLKSEDGLLNKSSWLARALGVAKFISTRYMILVTLCCAT